MSSDCLKKHHLNRARTTDGSNLPPKRGRRFVIQKHADCQLHYDFPLEINGVLVSWAIPKGLSTDPARKRLAIRTKDHSLQYADFEGVIPAGKYGAGTVMVWDQGQYRNLRAAANKGKRRCSMTGALQEGLLEIWLDGRKLQGGFALKRLRKAAPSKWLASKMKDSKADTQHDPFSEAPDSVLTGRSMREITLQAQADSA